MIKEAIPNLNLFAKAIMDRKAADVVILDVKDLTTFADAFIICSGKSNRQVMAIADHVQIEMKKHGIKPLNVEGKKEGHWILMDYGHVVIHIFFESTREAFDLEGLWTDAGRIAIKEII